MEHIIGVTNYNSNSYSLIALPPISVKNISVAAESFVLFQNYPNPFNPVTKIKFSLPQSNTEGKQVVRLVVFDILGREVITLIRGRSGLKPGTYEVEWNASGYPSGIYFYRLTAGKHTSIKKMCLFK